jgi:hypothetical protein
VLTPVVIQVVEGVVAGLLGAVDKVRCLLLKARRQRSSALSLFFPVAPSIPIFSVKFVYLSSLNLVNRCALLYNLGIDVKAR